MSSATRTYYPQSGLTQPDAQLPAIGFFLMKTVALDSGWRQEIRIHEAFKRPRMVNFDFAPPASNRCQAKFTVPSIAWEKPTNWGMVTNKRNPLFDRQMNEFRNSNEIGSQGQKTLAAEMFLSPDIFAQEQRQIFLNRWLYAGRADEFSKTGDFRVRQIGPESVIIVRGNDGQIRAHLNLCRHRGTRLCEVEQGTFANTIQCPYHAWTYGLDGQLVGVPDETQFDGFCRESFPLHSVACFVWEGFVWINLATDPEPFETCYSAVLKKFRTWHLAALVSAGRRDYDVKANWKLIVQNYSECYHCAPVHPGLTKLSPPKSGANDLVEGPILGGYMQVNKPGGSLTLSGRSCGVTVGDLSANDLQRVYYYVLFPQTLLSLHHDYVMVHTLWPQSPGQTRVECQWLFHPDSIGNRQWNPDDGIAFWDQTNREDWHVSELTQLGVASSRYAPGPYSNRESMSAAFDREYLKSMHQSIKAHDLDATTD